QGSRPEAHEAPRGNRPVDDARRAEKAGDHERLTPRASSERIRPADQRGESAARAVPRDAESDEEGVLAPGRGREVSSRYVWNEIAISYWLLAIRHSSRNS